MSDRGTRINLLFFAPSKKKEKKGKDRKEKKKGKDRKEKKYCYVKEDRKEIVQ